MGKDQELLEAARNGNVSVVEKILGQRAKRSGPLASLRRGPGANVQDSSGYSALHHAALNGHRDIVKLLLEYDASPNIVDSKGSSPLHLAAWSGNVDIVRLLLTGPAICNVNLLTKDHETALHCAAQYGHTPVVSLLLEHRCDPTIRNSRDESALDLAAQYGRLDSVELLVRTYPVLIQPLQRANRGVVFPHTPLHLASRNGHKNVVEVLLRAGVDVNIRTRAGTALHEAALCGKVEVVRTLLEHGVDIWIKDSHDFTVTDLLSQFPAHATQEIMGILKKFRRNRSNHITDSDGESISQPFPPVPNVDSDLGSPYENVRPSSKNSRSLNTDTSPSTSPHRWDFPRYHRPPEGFDDRRVSGTSANSMRLTRFYKSLPLKKRAKTTPFRRSAALHDNTPAQVDSIAYSFSQQLFMRKSSTSLSSYASASEGSRYSEIKGPSDCSRESDNSLYQMPCAPRAFMDSSVHSEDLQYLSAGREADQLSLSSTASSTGYPRRPDSSGASFYMPMNNARGGHSPGSNSKVSPTPPKKPPRRNLSVSPTHLPPMSMSVDGVSNNAYEYLFLAHSGARSQGNLNELDQDGRRERLAHGRSMDQYVEMNVFNIALDEEDEKPTKELQRGKSEDLDCRRCEPVAITSMYENVMIKQQNPRRKLRRNPEVYEEYDFRRKSEPETSSSAPETFVTSAFIMVSDSSQNANGKRNEKTAVNIASYPLSPTHYQQPPTPDHPPPSAHHAENFIHERIRPLSQPVSCLKHGHSHKHVQKIILRAHGGMYEVQAVARKLGVSQEYKRRSKDMETETEEEYLLICDESSGSFSSSVSLSDRSVDNIVEEYHSDAPFAGLKKGSSRVLENLSNNTQQPLERPKTLKKLKLVYDTSDNTKIDNQRSSNSSGSEKETENKENRDRSSALSPFDEQEEWAKIQEIMASFGTGIVRESVFVAELEKEFQSRLKNLSFSQTSLNNDSISTVEKWLQSLEMGEYAGLFISNGFDDINFLNGVLEEVDLKEMGITSELERQIILDSCKQLPCKIHNLASNNNNNDQSEIVTVDSWLAKIRLEHYSETFAKHLYHDMNRIRRIWDVELSAVLDIEKIGHRKRILASVSSGEHITTGPKLEDINADLNFLRNNIQQLKSELKSPSTHSTGSGNTGTIRHRHKKSRPAPPPPVNAGKNEQDKKGESEISIGGNNSIKSQWRHQPILLITGMVKYLANYLGSTCIKEFKGSESTRKSIKKVRKSSDKSPQEILLTISYRGVKFVNPQQQTVICDHEIRNIHCACQDPESYEYFAYITKDMEDYYCHVFQTSTSEQATEILLTLGQAYELAYQMALREQVTSKGKTTRDNHKTAISPRANSSQSRDFKESPTSSTRCDLKLNGHPLKMKSLTLSLASEPICEPQRTPTKVNFSDTDA